MIVYELWLGRTQVRELAGPGESVFSTTYGNRLLNRSLLLLLRGRGNVHHLRTSRGVVVDLESRLLDPLDRFVERYRHRASLSSEKRGAASGVQTESYLSILVQRDIADGQSCSASVFHGH